MIRWLIQWKIRREEKRGIYGPQPDYPFLCNQILERMEKRSQETQKFLEENRQWMRARGIPCE